MFPPASGLLSHIVPVTSTVVAMGGFSSSMGPFGTMVVASSGTKEFEVAKGTNSPERVKEMMKEVKSGAEVRGVGRAGVIVGLVVGLGIWL